MTDRRQIETFNQQLEAMLSGSKPDLNALSEDERQAIRIAAQLGDIDLSPQSVRRYSQRSRLLRGDHLRLRPTPGFTWRRSYPSSTAWSIAFPGATLLFVLAFVLGWTLTNLGRLSGSSDPIPATAFVIPRTSIESSLPPSEQNPEAQAFAPQPLPTPNAPPQLITYMPSTLDPRRTRSMTSEPISPAGVTQFTP